MFDAAAAPDDSVPAPVGGAWCKNRMKSERNISGCVSESMTEDTEREAMSDAPGSGVDRCGAPSRGGDDQSALARTIGCFPAGAGERPELITRIPACPGRIVRSRRKVLPLVDINQDSRSRRGGFIRSWNLQVVSNDVGSRRSENRQERLCRVDCDGALSAIVACAWEGYIPTGVMGVVTPRDRKTTTLRGHADKSVGRNSIARRGIVRGGSCIALLPRAVGSTMVRPTHPNVGPFGIGCCADEYDRHSYPRTLRDEGKDVASGRQLESDSGNSFTCDVNCTQCLMTAGKPEPSKVNTRMPGDVSNVKNGKYASRIRGKSWTPCIVDGNGWMLLQKEQQASPMVESPKHMERPVSDLPCLKSSLDAKRPGVGAPVVIQHPAD